MRHFILNICASVAALIAVLPVYAQITLKYNFKEGDTFRQNMITSMNMTQKIMDQEIKMDFSINTQMACRVKNVRDDSYTMEITHKAIIINMVGGNNSVTFDSNTPKDTATAQDVSPMLKAIVNKPVEIVVNSAGQVESGKGFDKLFEAMNNSLDKNISEQTKQQMTELIKPHLSEESFKNMFMQNSIFFPGKPVSTGDRWNAKTSIAVSNFAVDVDMNMTLKSVDDSSAVIDVDGLASMPENFEQELNGTKAKVTLKGTHKGLVKIDKDTGRIISLNATQNLSGDIEITGMKIPITAILTKSVTDN
ncbi:MAG: DUF6263 family protein [Prevotellaceae bacterium]|jgi:hypothetical protein|nr:DUF6263 family protein [Prevotellaceae bacterium]